MSKLSIDFGDIKAFEKKDLFGWNSTWRRPNNGIHHPYAIIRNGDVPIIHYSGGIGKEIFEQYLPGICVTKFMYDGKEWPPRQEVPRADL